ncbi:cytochrome-c oxidase, cbb3-type subunit III [Roseovarius sp. M141]|uniref:cytochrome-c oxidase, cbb3-type subunit III n=1 Tax=Roseovarius sp. M141 TaxID=2583806 RepID=UPI0020CE13D4|nr:cytochrome-c oxidase, cbb3-type subunit III [Roseovarius sp. M141]MCQ0090287.1 cytochrome-c oxidase, cbb3-type subunit III [Roseovarius sp. M141]
MSVKERDPLTGHQTTGHEWNGITELNTRVPRSVWFFIIVTHIFALIAWILLPTWPLVTTYTKGLLDRDQRDQVEAKVVAANVARADWADRITATPVSEILEQPELLARSNGTAHQIFGDNCAGCHGQDAGGGPGFPSLTDDAWLWGGDPETIMETLRVGINATHPDTRYAQMLAFGRDGLLEREDIRIVVDYVQSLSGAEISPDRAAAGEEIYVNNCSGCHGATALGDTEQGAPNLTDAFWIYGGDDKAMFDTIWDGRQGWMPAWEGRLTETERKILTVYLTDLAQEATP